MKPTPASSARRILLAAGAALVSSSALLAAGPSEKQTVEQFFKALGKKDRAAASALLHPEATLANLGEERPVAGGVGAVLDFLLGRFPEFPNWSATLGERIASGSWVGVRERVALEKGEKPREALFLFQVREGKIRRIWRMEGDGEGGGEGSAALLVEKWNEKDLPRFVGFFEGGAALMELPSGERIAAGEDDLRDRFEKSFDAGAAPKWEVLERMSLSPWVVYRSRGGMAPEPSSGDSLTVIETRGGLVRRIWFPRGEGFPVSSP